MVEARRAVASPVDRVGDAEAGNDQEQTKPGESARQDVPGAVVAAPGPPVEESLGGDEVLVVVEPDELLAVSVEEGGEDGADRRHHQVDR